MNLKPIYKNSNRQDSSLTKQSNLVRETGSSQDGSESRIRGKVGSIFGGGKLKEFEHRNEDLQNRIKELEEEAIQREIQHAKQIQEMKNAYK